MFSRALANLCTLATIGPVGDRPCRRGSLRRSGRLEAGRSWVRDRSRSASGGFLMADLDALTPRQREIYTFIRSKIQGRGYGPTVREIGLQFQIKSPNGVMCHLK